MKKFPTKKIVKIGIVVNNLEEAMKEYGELFDIEAPQVNVPVKYAQQEEGTELCTIFRGKKEIGRTSGCRVAMIYVEPIYIELIEAPNEPSPWTEFKEKHGQGVHYMAFEATGGFEEVEKLMENRGMPIYHKVERGIQRYGYFETEKKLGITIEYKEINQ